MIKHIRKRNGQVVPFVREKITRAIFKAAKAVGGNNYELADYLSRKVVKKAEEKYTIPSVEEIQDTVEKILIEGGYAKTSKAYILYREQRQKSREHNAFIGATSEMFNSYLSDEDWLVNENANTQRSIAGLNHYIREKFTKSYWLYEVYTRDIMQAHNNGDMHIHDLGMYAPYCMGWDIEQLLLEGLYSGKDKVKSSPAKHFNSILRQIVNATFLGQSETAGAQAWSSFDTYLAPFVRYDNLTYDQVLRGMESFVYEMNMATRVGGQCPFSNLTFDITIPNTFKDKAVISGGLPTNDKYGDFQEEVNIINKAFCEVMENGDSNGTVFTFPIPTLNITKDFDWDSPVVEDWMKITIKYGIPYFANYINSDMSPEDCRSMCPLTPDTKVLVKSNQNGIRVSTISDIVHTMQEKGTIYEVYTPEGWSKTKPVKVDATKVYEFTLSNGAKVKMGENHLQPIMGSTNPLLAKDLETNMWLPFNKKAFDSDLGTFNLGYAVGAYIGDGSHNENGIIYSLDSAQKDDETEKLLTSFWKSMGYKVNVTYNTRNVRFLRVNGNPYDIIKYYVKGENALNKSMKSSIYNCSVDFRQGVLSGIAATDGAREKKRLYTSSLELKSNIETLLSSLGMKYMSNYKDNREGRLGTNTNYRIDYPGRSNYGNLFKEDENYHYFRIVDKKEIDYKGNNLYCFEVDNDSKYFMLANGLITHNCRLRLNTKDLNKRGGGLFGSNPLTGSIGVCTINLPRMAYLSKDKDEFLKKLEEIIDIAKQSLEIKRKELEKELEKDLYPFTKFYLKGIKMRNGEYLANHFSTIGLIGMNEALLNLIGKDITTEEGQEFSNFVMEYLQELIIKIQEETDHLYNLEATPAEGTSYRLANIDKKKYPDIITAGSDEYYYTNSTQLPVGYTDNMFETLDLQDELQTKYTGGTVLHLYLGEVINDTNVVKKLVKRVFTKYKLPYISITNYFSSCPEHGYIPGEVTECPKCGAETSIWTRVTGYLRPVNGYNKGKKEEFKERKRFKLEVTELEEGSESGMSSDDNVECVEVAERNII
jgi:anaerobic ribonucleoside-triphosphate reductase